MQTCLPCQIMSWQTQAIIFTAQLPVAQWHDVIAEPTIADSTLDRLVNNAHRIELKGPSLRRQKLGENR